MNNYVRIENEKQGAILFKDISADDYYVFDSKQFESPIKDFLSFCQNTIHEFFYMFKYGVDYFQQAKTFHEDAELDRYQNHEPSKTFKEDFKDFISLVENDFKEKFGKNRLYPAIVLKKGSFRWKQYCKFLKGKLKNNDNFLVSAALKQNDVAVFCLEEDSSLTLLHHYTNDLNYKILRGKSTIGNLIEINYGSINLLLDCGKELDENMEQQSEIENRVTCNLYDGVLISHYHLDHAGLVEQMKSPIYMGKGCLDVINSQIEYRHGEILKNINCFEPNEEFSIKKGNFEIKITPILVDHSAYDSYMFLIVGGEKSLLYTGDFRSNGRKSFTNTLRYLPNKVDYLICEATNMFSQKKNISEKVLEQKAAEIMAQYKHVFVFQAGTNIDRLVSFYKASHQNKKVFLIDTYVAGITENLPNIPNVKTFKDVYCFWDFPLRLRRNDVKKYDIDWRLLRKCKKGLGSCEVGDPKNSVHGDLSNFTMLVRPSMLDYLKRVNKDKECRFNFSIFDDAVLIYSLWGGYKEKEEVKTFLDEMQKLGVKIVDLHTSGHADKQTIDRLKSKVNPSVIEYVHYISGKEPGI